MVDGGRWMVEDVRGTICIAFQAKLGRWVSHTPGLHPGLLTLRSWRLPDTPVAEGDTPSPDDPHRLSSAERKTVGGRSCQSPAAGFCARTRSVQTQKKESTSMRLTPESGGYLLSRNSVPSAIASLTSLFGMGRGGTSLP